MLKKPYFLINAKERQPNVSNFGWIFLAFFCWNFFNPFLTVIKFCQILKEAGIGGWVQKSFTRMNPLIFKKNKVFSMDTRYVRLEIHEKYLKMLS